MKKLFLFCIVSLVYFSCREDQEIPKAKVYDVNARDKEGRSQLHRAALNGNLEDVKILLAKDPKGTSNQDNNSDRPIHLAAMVGNMEVIKTFLDEVNCTVYPNLYVDVKNKDGQTPLHKASLNGHPKVVYFLIQRGANVNAQTREGEVPLHYATYNDNTGNIECINILIDNKAQINSQNHNRETPLFHAVRYGSVKAIKALLDRGAQVNLPDGLGKTPFDEAKSYIGSDAPQNRKQAIEVLKAAGGKSK